jgi:hypothetical protein
MLTSTLAVVPARSMRPELKPMPVSLPAFTVTGPTVTLSTLYSPFPSVTALPPVFSSTALTTATRAPGTISPLRFRTVPFDRALAQQGQVQHHLFSGTADVGGDGALEVGHGIGGGDAERTPARIASDVAQLVAPVGGEIHA